ncbi:dipeptide/oligopeptide/nickel ABC transporter permease/ATP-binding protein [Candidatus Pantoea bituminis]|uniref:dipeptide/oligopeptide/nickel ABC transporter permease/ATP-binding protein n=1 Tax=Candidatus Pantoea bituminis TaxID=2831036 RepID=UPI001C060E5D|nr:dipeptide/oligopeptide/nickel ABC transporter permease/ATP-binding protein [Pantoea bituminis]
MGLLVGILAGYYGSFIDNLFMRLTDIFFAFPRLVLALALSAVLGAGLFNAVFAIVISAWPPYARQARAEVLTIMETDFIKAARLSGASDFRIIFHYILPLCMSSAFIRLALDLSGIIIIAAGLGFLGLGIQPPTPEWGAMISEGRQYISTAWWISIFPGLSILFMSAAFTLLGDGLRDTFDPKRSCQTMTIPLLELENLSVFYQGCGVVKDVTLTLNYQQKIAIVGESGSGKTQLARAIAGILPDRAQVTSKRFLFSSSELTMLSRRARQAMRGREIAMIMQDPHYSLNPVMRIGEQITEVYRYHFNLPQKVARQHALKALSRLHINDPEKVFNAWPHQISGGMGQRVMIAMMMAASPKLLIADEPTSSLDSSTSIRVINELDQLFNQHKMSLIFITHDIELATRFCDDIIVMYRGQIVEKLRANLIQHAQHPYTQGLLNCIPRAGNLPERLPTLHTGAMVI